MLDNYISDQISTAVSKQADSKPPGAYTHTYSICMGQVPFLLQVGTASIWTPPAARLPAGHLQ